MLRVVQLRSSDSIFFVCVFSFNLDSDQSTTGFELSTSRVGRVNLHLTTMNSEKHSGNGASDQAPFRSPLLMNAGDSALVVIDVQEKLIPLIPAHEHIVWNINRLLDGAAALGVKVCGTEQYPSGLGETIEPLAMKIKAQSPGIPDKTMFSCRECDAAFKDLSAAGVHNLLICGIESHVCVAQSALDFLAQGFNVFVCVDAVGSRHAIDHQTALRRMENSGVVLTTTEAALFEWCEKAGSDGFKQISKIVRQPPPS